eukprot:CFRG0252T1
MGSTTRRRGAFGDLKQRKGDTVSASLSAAYNVHEEDELEEKYGKNAKLTLMDELMLLGLDPKAGYTSVFNDSLSTGLRGAIMIELALRKRIALQTQHGARNLSLCRREVIVLDHATTGEIVLDEALRNIAQCPETVGTWIEYLSGEAWNPLKLKFQLRHVRERLSKGLCEKGILTTSQKNFFIFDVTTHPVIDMKAKEGVSKKIQDSLLSHWVSDTARFNERDLSRIILAHASDVLDYAFAELEDDEFEKATDNAQLLLDSDPEIECKRSCAANDIIWAVFDFFTNQ